MSLFLSNRDGGKTNEEGHYRFQTKVWNGNVLSGLNVTQNSPLAMSVLVTAGDAKIDYNEYGYTIWNDASESVTITTADPSNPRIDRVVVYVDRGATPQTTTPNNPDIPIFAVVAGTPAGSPTRPSDSDVNSAVGAGNPWCDLADVAVAAGVTTISNVNITDTRSFITVPDLSVGTDGVINGAITPGKRSGGFKIGVFTSTLGTTGNKVVTGLGFTPKSVLFFVNPNTAGNTSANSGIGAIDGTSQFYVAWAADGSNGTRNGSQSACFGWTTSGSATPSLLATFVSLDSNGFTVNVTTASSTFAVNWIALG